LANTEYGSQSVTDEFYHYYGGALAPRNTPLQSVSQVEYNNGDIESPDYEVLTEDEDYTVILERSQIHFIEGFSPKHGLKRFKLDYTYGYNSVPSRVKMLATKMVAKRVLDSLLSSDVNQDDAGIDVQVGSIQVKKPSDYGVENYKQLKMEIEKLKEDVVGGATTFRTNVYT